MFSKFCNLSTNLFFVFSFSFFFFNLHISLPWSLLENYTHTQKTWSILLFYKKSSVFHHFPWETVLESVSNEIVKEIILRDRKIDKWYITPSHTHIHTHNFVCSTYSNSHKNAHTNIISSISSDNSINEIKVSFFSLQF